MLTTSAQAAIASGPQRTLLRLLTGSPPEPDTDWEQVLELARRHGLSPFLYHALRPHRDRLPAEADQALRALYYQAVARSLFRGRQLREVLDALGDAGVPVVLLKGAAVARSVYPDPALRTMSDLDLWIPREQLEVARSALQSLGYTVHSKQNRPLALQDVYLGETQMVSADPTRGLVELHWNVFPGEWLRCAARIDETPLWERSLPLEEIAARRLAAEDMVLNTCLHLVINHQLGVGSIRSLLDLHLIQARFPLNWDAIARRARAWQVKTALWLALDLWIRLFGPQADVPLAALQPSPLRRAVLRRMASPRLLWSGRTFEKGWQRRIFLLCLVDRPWDAVRLTWHAFLPERQWLVLLYGLEDAPAWRVRLQQLWHPFRVLLRGNV